MLSAPLRLGSCTVPDAAPWAQCAGSAFTTYARLRANREKRDRYHQLYGSAGHACDGAPQQGLPRTHLIVSGPSTSSSSCTVNKKMAFEPAGPRSSTLRRTEMSGRGSPGPRGTRRSKANSHRDVSRAACSRGGALGTAVVLAARADGWPLLLPLGQSEF